LLRRAAVLAWRRLRHPYQAGLNDRWITHLAATGGQARLEEMSTTAKRFIETTDATCVRSFILAANGRVQQFVGSVGVIQPVRSSMSQFATVIRPLGLHVAILPLPFGFGVFRPRYP
jgi:hypothetical protein